MFRNHTEVVRTPVASSAKRIAASPDCVETYSCEFCDQEWQSESELFLHKTKHISRNKRNNEEDPFCWTCIRKFDNKPDLTEHFKQRHLLCSEDAKRVEHQIFVCDVCNAVLFNKKMLAIHIAYLHCNVERLLECTNCPKNINANRIWGHFYNHNMIGMYTCPICFIKFHDWNNLNCHLKEHPHLLYCDMCGKNYDEISTFNQHFKQHELTLTDFKCNNNEETDIYDRYFVGSYNSKNIWKLLPHRGLTLPKEIKICVFCKEICTTYEERRLHVLSHQFFKPKQEQEDIKVHFACSCGQIFFNRVLLKQHLHKNKGSEIFHCSV